MRKMINHAKAKELGINPERVRQFIKEIEQQWKQPKSKGGTCDPA